MSHHGTPFLRHYWGDRLPATIVHGDTDLGTTFRRADGASRFLDWQVVHRSHRLRDLTYFLVSSVPVEMRRRYERDLIGSYLDGLAARNVRVPGANDAWQLYRLFAAEAWDATISTVAFGGLQEQENSLAAVARGNAAVTDLELGKLVADIVSSWTSPA